MAFTVFQKDLGFIEGPVWTAAGDLALVSISQGCIYVLDGASGAVRQKVHTGGGPNGLAARGDELFAAQNGGLFGASGKMQGCVQKLSGGIVLELLGEHFTGPNDLCFGPDGRLYVTDPLTDKALTEPVEGRVMACDLASGKCEEIIGARHFPNGIAFDATGKILYVTQTYPRVIERFSVEGGRFTSLGVLCTMTSGRPDGMAIDEEGKLWVCTPGTGGVEVWTAEGQFVQRIELGAGTMNTNCCFGGPQGTDLFITAAGLGQVLKLDAGVKGLALFPRG